MRSIGIYHQVDLALLNLVAELRAKGADDRLVRNELSTLAADLGIRHGTVAKRMGPARKAWMVRSSPIVQKAAELYPSVTGSDRLALHTAVVLRAYPFFLDVLMQVGTAYRLGTVVRQATVRDRLVRRYGHLANVYQGVQKVLQSLVSWDILAKTSEPGVYVPKPPVQVRPEVAEVLVAAILEAGERGALPVSSIATHAALFHFKIPGWTYVDGPLLRYFTEGSREIFAELIEP